MYSNLERALCLTSSSLLKNDHAVQGSTIAKAKMKIDNQVFTTNHDLLAPEVKLDGEVAEKLRLSGCRPFQRQTGTDDDEFVNDHGPNLDIYSLVWTKIATRSMSGQSNIHYTIVHKDIDYHAKHLSLALASHSKALQ